MPTIPTQSGAPLFILLFYSLQKFFHFYAHLPIFAFVTYTVPVFAKNSLSIPKCCSGSQFPSNNSIVSGVASRSLTYFELTFVYRERSRSRFILHMAPSLSTVYRRHGPFPSVHASYVYWESFGCKCVGLFLGSHFRSTGWCLFFPGPYWVEYSSFWICFEVTSCDAPSFALFCLRLRCLLRVFCDFWEVVWTF